jgi:uncharacterized protein (TIRG00374 family)
LKTPAKVWFRILLGLACGGAFAYLAFVNISWSEIAAAILHLNAWWLLAGTAFLAFDFALRIARWWILLRGMNPRVRYRDCATAFLSSISINNVLPLRAGDFVRVFAFRKQLGLGAVRLIGSMLVERLVDLLTLLSIFFLTLNSVPAGVIEPWLVDGARTLAIVVVIAIAGVLLFSGQVHRLMLWIADRPFMHRGGLGAKVRSLADQMVEVVQVTKDWWVSTQVLLLSYAAWLFEGLAFYAVAKSLGLSTAAISNWFAMAACTLSTLVPGTPGYVGTFHYFAKESQVAFGCGADDAAAYALVVHFVVWFPVTVVGLIVFAMTSHQSVNLPNAVLHRPEGKEASAV